MEITIAMRAYNNSLEFSKSISVNIRNFKEYTEKTGDRVYWFLMDGSTIASEAEIIRGICKDHGIRYFGEPEMVSPYERMLLAAKSAETKFYKDMDCSDIVNPETVFKCVEFLEKNDDYISAGGYYRHCIRLSRIPNRVTMSDISLHQDIDADDPLQRAADATWYTDGPSSYDVLRRDVYCELLEVMINAMGKELITDRFGWAAMEFIFAGMVFIKGKRKYFDSFYNLKLNLEGAPGEPVRNSSVDTSLKFIYSSSPENNKIEKFFASIKTIIEWLLPNDAARQQYAMYIYMVCFGAMYTHWAKFNVLPEWMREFNVKFDSQNEYKFKEHTPNYVAYFKNPYTVNTENFGENARIAIYGAGNVGEMICEQLRGEGRKDMFFVDKNSEKFDSYCSLPVLSLTELQNESYDYIVVAHDYLDDKINQSLLEIGVEEGKLIRINKPTEQFTTEELYNIAKEYHRAKKAGELK